MRNRLFWAGAAGVYLAGITVALVIAELVDSGAVEGSDEQVQALVITWNKFLDALEDLGGRLGLGKYSEDDVNV